MLLELRTSVAGGGCEPVREHHAHPNWHRDIEAECEFMMERACLQFSSSGPLPGNAGGQEGKGEEVCESRADNQEEKPLTTEKKSEVEKTENEKAKPLPMLPP